MRSALVAIAVGLLCLGSSGIGPVQAADQVPAPTPGQGLSVRSDYRPSELNTGVPSGTPLKVHEGNLTITKPGTVIEQMDIRGFVVVKAPRVTIRRSIIRGGTTAPRRSTGLLSIIHDSAKRYLIEDVTLRPQVASHNIDGVKVRRPGMIRRVNISGTIDGIMIYGSGVKVRGSHLHGLLHYAQDPGWGGRPSHDDAIQVQAGKNISIVGNTLEGGYNAAVQVTQDVGRTRNLTIARNWISGGGCSLNFKSNGPRTKRIKVISNRFGRGQRIANCAMIHNPSRSGMRPTGNVWTDTGMPVSATRGS